MGGLGRGRGGGGGGGLGGGGQGTFPSTCHILHYHTVHRPEGTSHNNRGLLFQLSWLQKTEETFRNHLTRHVNGRCVNSTQLDSLCMMSEAGHVIFVSRETRWEITCS